MDRSFPSQYEHGDYMQTFIKEWKEVVCDENGNLILDKVARELKDYSLLMECTSYVYCDIANLSKPFTNPIYILDAINEDIKASAEELVKERYQELLDRIAELEEQLNDEI